MSDEKKLRIGYKLIAEGYDPKEIVRQTVLAEEAGFDFVEVSDHFHPWVPEQQHSGFAFSMLANAAAKTERIELVTGVTCPMIRYHPAIVAQAAATNAILSDGRFTLGVGSGEQLNEHVVGHRWPAVKERHEMFRESLEIIRLLWEGGYKSYYGKHLKLVDARVFDLPETPPEMPVAISGPASAKIAAELGDGIFATEPLEDLVKSYEEAGGSGPKYSEVPLAYAKDEDTAAKSAHEKFRFGLTGWKVLSELPNPVNFDAATAFITPDDMKEAFGCGPDPERHIEVAQGFVDAGFDNLALINAGPDPDAFMEFFANDLADRIRSLTPSG